MCILVFTLECLLFSVESPKRSQVVSPRVFIVVVAVLGVLVDWLAYLGS